jgi:hypothetical protein
MFDFYCGVNNYERAEDCIYKILPMLLNAQPPDSPAIMHQLSNLVCLQLESKEYDAAIRNSEYVLDYAARNDTRYLERPILVLVKSVLMEAGEYRRLKQFFHDRYPAELANIARTEPAVYYQLKAAFAEANNQPDTANKYYRLAGIEILAAHGTPGAISFYLRHFGKFLLHLGKHKEAIRTIDSALHYAVIVQYHPYMAELSGILDSLYAVEGDYVRAYQYAKLNKQYNGQLLSANRQDEILALDLENEIRAQALLVQQEEERTRHRHNVQYMSITLLIGIFFGILLMLDVFRMPVWLISAMSFISFIFLFEFIILLIDHKVHEITHGEPWMILAIKVVIIAGLLPLHHWLEHSVVDYLRDHHLMANAREKLQPAIRRMRHFAGASSKSLSVIANERPKAGNAEEQARPDAGPTSSSATIQEQLPLPPSG